MATRIQHGTEKPFFGCFSKTIALGQVASRFLAFIPSENQQAGYVPEILFQDLKVAEAHNGLYWAPVSQVQLRRDKLGADDAVEKIAEVEAALELFEKFEKVSPEAGN